MPSELLVTNFPTLPVDRMPSMFFQQWGTVTSCRFTDGEVLVKFEKLDSAQRALADLQGLQGRGISVFEGSSPLEASIPQYNDRIILFVGQLQSFCETCLRELFAPFGTVTSVSEIPRRTNNISNAKILKHCAFVEMSQRPEGLRALEALHNSDPYGVGCISVREAHCKSSIELVAKLFVGMLPTWMEASDLRDLFANFGHVEEATIMRIRGKSRGCGWVRLSSVDSCSAAIAALHGKAALRPPRSTTNGMVLEYLHVGFAGRQQRPTRI